MTTLALIGFSEVEKAQFSAILTLAERWLEQSWTITDVSTADFFLIKDRLIPEMDEHETLKRLPRKQCVFITRQPVAPSLEGHQFYWREQEAPSLRNLIDFLNKISDLTKADRQPPPRNIIHRPPLVPKPPRLIPNKVF